MEKKVEKAYEIRDAKILFVNLVDKAANQRAFLITKAENGAAEFTTRGRIVKAAIVLLRWRSRRPYQEERQQPIRMMQWSRS